MSKDMQAGVPTDLTIGADPELFVLDRKTGKAVSAHTYFPGTKYDPFMVTDGAVQVDGVAAEFNIFPASTAEEFQHNIESVLKAMQIILKKKTNDCYLAAIPVVSFEKEYFDNLPEETKRLGCEPDFNAYTKKTNPTPNAKRLFRTGAGHVHLGFVNGANPMFKEHFDLCCKIVKQLDAALFIPSHAWDKDTKRRELYGDRGAFRPKTYGLEYRTLSNAWLTDPGLIEWVYSSTTQAFKLLDGEDTLLVEQDYFKDFNKRTDKVFTPKDIREYMGFLVDYGFLPLPEEYWT